MIRSFCSTVLLLCTISFSAFAQTFEVPQAYSFKNKADYARHEKDIIAASKWLFAIPLDEQESKRKQVAKFVAEWLLGSPSVNAEMSEAIMDFETKNPGMMALYFAGCCIYVLENNYSTDIRAKHRAALQLMMEYYKSDKGTKKDKKMKALIKQTEEGKLNEWLEVNIPLRS
jgi:hypothetical protein